MENRPSSERTVFSSEYISGELSPKTTSFGGLATNTLEIFLKKLDEIAKSSLEKY